MPFFPEWARSKASPFIPTLSVCGTGTAQRREPGRQKKTRPTSSSLAWGGTRAASHSTLRDLICPIHGSRRRPRRMFRPCRLSQRAAPIRPAETSIPPFSWNTAKQDSGLRIAIFLCTVFTAGLGRMLGRAACLICSGRFLRGRDALAPIPSRLPLGDGLGPPGLRSAVACRAVEGSCHVREW